MAGDHVEEITRQAETAVVQARSDHVATLPAVFLGADACRDGGAATSVLYLPELCQLAVNYLLTSLSLLESAASRNFNLMMTEPEPESASGISTEFSKLNFLRKNYFSDNPW